MENTTEPHYSDHGNSRDGRLFARVSMVTFFLGGRFWGSGGGLADPLWRLNNGRQ